MSAHTTRRDTKFHLYAVAVVIVLGLIALAISLATDASAATASYPVRPYEKPCKKSDDGTITCYHVPGLVSMTFRDKVIDGKPNVLYRPAVLTVQLNCNDGSKTFTKQVGLDFNYVINQKTAPKTFAMMVLSFCDVIASIALQPSPLGVQRIGMTMPAPLVVDELHQNG